MADADARLKQLKIKTGVVKRLAKEVTCYEADVGKEEARLERMGEADAPDEYAMKKQREVIAESRAMVPDARRRLHAAVDDLRQAIDEATDLNEKDEFSAAKTVLDENPVSA